MSKQFDRELSAAIQAVSLAAEICRTVQAQITPNMLEKKDRSPVTIADYASQAVICRQLREVFPDDFIVAEEDAATLREEEQQGFLDRTVAEIRAAGIAAEPAEVISWVDAGSHDAAARRYWTLDPIDGTKGFLRKEQFAISLALLIDGEIQVAALGCPNLPGPNGTGVLLTAIRGRGAKMAPLTRGVQPSDFHPIHVSKIADLAEARLCESVESGHSAHDESAAIHRLLGLQAPPLRMDSQAKYGVLARGDAEIYLRLPTRKDYVEKIWDHAGGVLVIEEAGGRVSDVQGNRLDFHQGATLKNNQGVVATNGLLHDVVLEALKSLRQ
ncbi:3'(2'),5'-bisphosphate nucleotidase [Planctomicrobium sp. SH664]|uniref:3'(2'),5'-bisphosphate nucleotidase n=1 Tax=Planctomicrobium sp. SH664 TaxID=3448125 RepID=UPI003F5C88DF